MAACRARGRHVIDIDAIRQYFLGVVKADIDDQDIRVDPGQLAKFMANARERMDQPGPAGIVDTVDTLLARLRG